jgi:hypothetical protein
MRHLALGLILGVSLAQSSLGQTTRPATRRANKNGLAASNEEIQARMDAMNRRAASRPTTQPTTEDAARRRAQYIETQRHNAEFESHMYQQAQATVAAASAALPQLRRDIATLQRDGSAAEQELDAILNEYEALRTLADRAGHSTFEGTTEGTYDGEVRGTVGGEEMRGRTSGRYGGRTSGDIYNPGERLAAIMAVESQYGPELKRARTRVSELYAQYVPLLATHARASKDLANATRISAASLRRYNDAVKNLAAVGVSLTAQDIQQPPQQAGPATADDAAIWQEAERMYPGVDVRAVWSDAMKDAIDTIGADNPKLRDLASKLFHDKARALAGGATTQPTAGN